MARTFREKKLVVASHNPGKVREIAELLSGFDFEVVSAKDLGLPEPEETGATFDANARLKALAATEASGLPALADDSGLVVPALGGDPGIYSARWAGPDKDFDVAIAKVEAALQAQIGQARSTGPDQSETDDRSAYFVAVLAICWPDQHIESVEGRAYGRLVSPPRGDHGFGYDPIFVPNGHDLTFGEMESNDKHAISHRAHAFRQLVENCFS
jgi:XTP/dITP diphosphohydrolase